MASRKGIYIYVPKNAMVVRNCINIFVLLDVVSEVWSNGMNPSSISQQFNSSHQLMIVFFVHYVWRFCSLYGLKAIPTKSVGQRIVFVGRDTVFLDGLNRLNSQLR